MIVDDPQESPAIRYARVTEVDLAAARCVVELGEIISPPLPWIESRAGAVRSWSPPSVGEQVLLICPEGELGAGLVLRGVNCAAFPPAGDSSEELILFDDGARIAYDPVAHVLTADLPGGSRAMITATDIEITGAVTITGDVLVSGEMTLIGGIEASADVVAGGKSLRNHRHGGVSAGGGQTLPPT